jgi:hypothetical protein
MSLAVVDMVVAAGVEEVGMLDEEAVAEEAGDLSTQTTETIITSAAMEDEEEVWAVEVGAMAVEVVVVVATIMGRIVGMMDGNEVLLQTTIMGRIVGMTDGMEDEVLLRTTVITIARRRTIIIARLQIIDRTSRKIHTRMVVMERVAVVDLVLVLALTLVVQMNLGAAQDNTNTSQGTIETTRIDAITETGTRIAETDDVVILRDVSITTGNKIEKIKGITETDEMEASRVYTQQGRIDRKATEGTRVDSKMIV